MQVRRLELVTQRKTRREQRAFPYYARSKYVAWTRAAAMLGVHAVLEFVVDATTVHALVDERDALLHHYRRWDGDEWRLGSDTPVVDRRMHQFRDEVVARTAARLRQPV